ncbi:MAG: amidohydrolase family protein [Phycisphaerae bacterium]|jgi:hypothetical protein
MSAARMQNSTASPEAYRRPQHGPGLLVLLLAAAFAAATCLADPPAGDDEGRFVVIKAGRIITVSGEEIRQGMIVLSGGRIRNVGRNLEYPLSAKVIDARNRVVMPGLINPQSRFGLDSHYRGGVHGDLTAAAEFYPRPDMFLDLLKTGYTSVALIPAGSGIPGRAMVVHTGGSDEQRTVASPSYLWITTGKSGLRSALKHAQDEIDKVEKAREEFEKKRAEEQQKQEPPKDQDKPAAADTPPPTTQPTTQPAEPPKFEPPPIDPAYQVLVDLIQKKPGVSALIEVDSASDYVYLSEVLAEFEIAHDFLAHNGRMSDLDYVVDKLGEKKARLVLEPFIGRVPYSAEWVHLVRQFADAGCEVTVMPVRDTPEEHGRVLGRLADLVRNGWSREEAIKSVTLHPARLLGLDDRLGTIEKDKEADLLFLDADPLNPTARVRAVMIAGEMVYDSEETD